MKTVLWIVIILTTFISSIWFFIQHQQYYTKQFNADYYADLYSLSQYVLGPASKGGIGDDGLYAFAGYYYFMQSGDVSRVNFEHPPLGKYLIGLSIYLFHNENVINIIYFFFILLFVYKIALITFNNKLLASIVILITSMGPLLRDHALRSMLDLPSSLFFIIGVYFFLVGIKKAKYIYASMLFFSFAFATKFFPALLLIFIFLLVVLYISARRRIFHFFSSLIILPLVYLFLHASFFIYHPSFIEFLRHKKWMIAWFSGTPRIFGNIARNIFTGYYIDSTGELVQNEYWYFLIPFYYILAFLSIFLIRKMKNRIKIVCIYGISAIFFVYSFILTTGLQKFLMPVSPLIRILAILSVYRFYSIILPWNKRILMKSRKK